MNPWKSQKWIFVKYVTSSGRAETNFKPNITNENLDKCFIDYLCYQKNRKNRVNWNLIRKAEE